MVLVRSEVDNMDINIKATVKRQEDLKKLVNDLKEIEQDANSANRRVVLDVEIKL